MPNQNKDSLNKINTQLLVTSSKLRKCNDCLATAMEAEARVLKLNEELKSSNESLVKVLKELQEATVKLEAVKAEMTHLALQDHLTELPNRLKILTIIEDEISKAKIKNTSLAILFMDLNDFKPINDNFCHAVGDTLLQTVAKRLSNTIRESDTVGRMGGDEFVAILLDAGSKGKILHKVNEIHNVLTDAYSLESKTFNIGISIGISRYPEDGEDAKTLLHNADTAMYKAKRNPDTYYHFFSD